MHKVSDGQRRRVQICMGLLYPFKNYMSAACFIPRLGYILHIIESPPIDFIILSLDSGRLKCGRFSFGILKSGSILIFFQVLLLDEVTVDLDVVARMDLLDFFKEECEQRGATIVYATHIFDGFETRATHLAYIQDGELKRAQKLLEVEELKSSVSLLSSPGFVLKPSRRKRNPKILPKRHLLLVCRQDTWRITADILMKLR
ncbi:putative P-loop containing nucleoside triphosphate hydrolase [Rosa chinensis]|uniref:Putative P-loop containing nucleoside triphosphate hydrolase n=1 Tax=Rosa chinensis TaxID=74649 RepID=A0A2P6QF16_ROSCH|nr:putative P-loop containing nucleoside triphosphate hydrolase [Rosa chinensis]